MDVVEAVKGKMVVKSSGERREYIKGNGCIVELFTLSIRASDVE